MRCVILDVHHHSPHPQDKGWKERGRVWGLIITARPEQGWWLLLLMFSCFAQYFCTEQKHEEEKRFLCDTT